MAAFAATGRHVPAAVPATTLDVRETISSGNFAHASRAAVSSRATRTRSTSASASDNAPNARASRSSRVSRATVSRVAAPARTAPRCSSRTRCPVPRRVRASKVAARAIPHSTLSALSSELTAVTALSRAPATLGAGSRFAAGAVPPARLAGAAGVGPTRCAPAPR